jgi:thiosulfate dehydrogenase [quinone] large subunit
MNKRITIAASVLRLLLGWFMFVDGLQILLTPNWSAAGFLAGAKTFPVFYAWFAMASNSWWVNPLNSWGITLIGVALILGVGIKPASWAAAALMILYYFPHYSFPIVPNGYIVEEHIIYASAFILVAVFPAAQTFGLAKYVRETFLGRIPVVRALI